MFHLESAGWFAGHEERKEAHKAFLEESQKLEASKKFDIAIAKSGDAIPDEFIVVLKPGVNPDTLLSEIGFSRHDIRAHAVDNDRHLRVYKNAVKGFSCRLTAAERARLASDSRVKFIEQDRVIKIDPREINKPPVRRQDGEQPEQVVPPGIERAGVRESKTVAFDQHRNVRANIASLDSGVELDHPDLNVTHNVTFVERTKTGNDDLGHGTRTMGIAAAKNNEIGVVGTCPGADTWAIKVVDATGSGRVSDVLAGLDYATKNAKDIDVLNASLGMNGRSQALEDGFNKCVDAGITIVVAAGNNHEATSNWTPALLKRVITVTAFAVTSGKRGQGPSETGARDKADYFITDMSNHDPKNVDDPNNPYPVELSASGSDVYSTTIGQSYDRGSGTSFAAPVVTGIVGVRKEQLRAMLKDKAYQRRYHISVSEIKLAMTPAQIKQDLIREGKLQTDPDYGFGGDPDNMHEPSAYEGSF